MTQHIGADNKLIGQTAAEYVAKTILGGEGGKVIEIQGTPGASATTDRHDEFVSWLTDNDPKVEIVDSVVGDYKRENALTAMNDLLQKYGPGEVDVVYTHNDAMALGVIAALETAGRLDEFKVVGIDGQNEAIQAIKDGQIVVTFTYDNAGKEACETAAKLLAGETVDPTGSCRPTRSTPTNVDDWLGKGFARTRSRGPGDSRGRGAGLLRRVPDTRSRRPDDRTRAHPRDARHRQELPGRPRAPRRRPRRPGRRDPRPRRRERRRQVDAHQDPGRCLQRDAGEILIAGEAVVGVDPHEMIAAASRSSTRSRPGAAPVASPRTSSWAACRRAGRHRGPPQAVEDTAVVAERWARYRPERRVGR